jgi:acyl carrier protein
VNAVELRDVLLSCLLEVAPEIDGIEIDPDVDLREQIDIDSMDFLNFLTAVHESTGVDIPEADYPKLATLAACIRYLGARVEAEDA